MDLQTAVALVTGANGFVGSRVTEALAARGATVLALARRPGEVPVHPSVEEVLGDFTDPGTAHREAGRADAVVHCAASLSRDLEAARRANRDGTRVLAAAALQHECRHFVHISTGSVYERSGRGVRDEDTPRVTTGDAYSVTKAEAEREIEAAVAEGLSATILRPPAVLGWAPTSTWGQRMPERIRDGQLPDRDDDRPFAWVHVDDLCDAALAALEQEAAGPYNVVGGVTTWGHYAAEVSSWFADGSTAVPPGVSNDLEARYPGDRIAETLGFEPRRSFADGMEEAAAHWR